MPTPVELLAAAKTGRIPPELLRLTADMLEEKLKAPPFPPFHLGAQTDDRSRRHGRPIDLAELGRRLEAPMPPGALLPGGVRWQPDDIWAHAACLTIATTGQKWGDNVEPTPAMAAVYKLWCRRAELRNEIEMLEKRLAGPSPTAPPGLPHRAMPVPSVPPTRGPVEDKADRMGRLESPLTEAEAEMGRAARQRQQSDDAGLRLAMEAISRCPSGDMAEMLRRLGFGPAGLRGMADHLEKIESSGTPLG